MINKPKLVIIGGGIVGITIAREASISNLFSKITIVEKDRKLGSHATTRNSGVIHAGFYYSPETRKAKFCSEANKIMRAYCTSNNVPILKCGKVVVSKNEREDDVLRELYERGKANSCKINLFKSNKLKEYEPLANTNKYFLWSPNTWSTSPEILLEKLIAELKEMNIEIKKNCKIYECNDQELKVDINEKIEYDFLINTAGGNSLKIAKLCGLNIKYQMIPFKGLYLRSNKFCKDFNSHIYPVPDINQPFLGIHTTITYNQYLKLGPTALPVFSPENYNFLNGINLEDLPELITLQLKLLTRNDFNFRDLAIREIKYLIKENIIKEAQKITNYKLLKNDFSWYSPGIRPQLYNIEKNKLEMDFVVNEEHNRIHILNSISPAWTCSFKTAKEIMKLVRKKIN